MSKARCRTPTLVRAKRRKRATHSRCGAILIAVLACLLVGVLIAGLTLQTAMRGRREAKLQRQLAQTEWLCEGGIVRAVAALKHSTEYTGETWQPDLNMEPLEKAVVDIQVKPVRSADAATDSKADNEDDEAQAWTIHVTARLDSTSDIDGPMQRTQTLTIKQLSEVNTKSEKSE